MTQTLSRRLVAFILSLAALVLTERAMATSCAAPALESSRERADVIFVGTASAQAAAPGHMTTTSFRVDRVLKGSAPGALRVAGGGMKGASFQAGQRYLVFGTLRPPADGEPPELFAHLCGGTQLAAQASGWLEALGPGDAPAPAGSPLVSGKRAAPTVPSSSTPPSVASAPEPAPPPPAAPATAPPPAASPEPVSPNANPAPGGGCAGCAAAPAPVTPVGYLIAVALVAIARRRRRRSARGLPSAPPSSGPS